MNDLSIRFPDAEKFAFLHENAHLMLITFPRDQAEFLYLIQNQNDNGIELSYPGATYCERVMDEIRQIFFIQVTDESGVEVKYVLGSAFRLESRLYGAYYQRAKENPDVIVFRIEGESPNQSLLVLEEDEFRVVSQEFKAQHQDVLQIAIRDEA